MKAKESIATFVLYMASVSHSYQMDGTYRDACQLPSKSVDMVECDPHFRQFWRQGDKRGSMRHVYYGMKYVQHKQVEGRGISYG